MNAGRIGIIAGSGPEAGIDLWAKLLDENRRSLGDRFQGDIDAPYVAIESVPELALSMRLPATADEVWRHLREVCEHISERVDAFAIACNSLYFFEDAIEQLGLPAKLISPVDSVRAEADRRGNGPLALLGAAPVTDLAGKSSPYARLCEDVELELPSDRPRLQRLIENIKLQGGPSPALDEEFGIIASRLTSPVGVLACTELPLLNTDEVTIELIDVNRLLAQDVLRAARQPGL